MLQHRGEIVETAARKSGYTIKKLAERLKISRNTLYNKFNESDLSYDFIIQVSNIIHYNFSPDFPELKLEALEDVEEASGYRAWDMVMLIELKRKYMDLLERYNKLLGSLVKLTHDHELQAVRQKIRCFIENDQKA